MKKKSSKKSTPKKVIFTSRRPSYSMSELVVMSRALDKVRGQKISDTDKLMESVQNDMAIPRGAHGGVLRRGDIWQGRQLDGKNVEADDWLSEYGIFHKEAEKAVKTNNGLPIRRWSKVPRNTYQKWLKKNKKGGKKCPKRKR